jgi:hypothetical protein
MKSDVMRGTVRRGTTALAQLLACVMLSAVTGTPSVAHAEDQRLASEPRHPSSMNGEVWVVHAATANDEGIDPGLSGLRALKQPPFDAYRSMKILSRQTLDLPLDQPVEIEITRQRILVLRLVARLPDGRAKLELSFKRRTRTEAQPPIMHVISSAKEPFFVAGQKFRHGMLVIGVRVSEHSKAIR